MRSIYIYIYIYIYIVHVFTIFMADLSMINNVNNIMFDMSYMYTINKSSI